MSVICMSLVLFAPYSSQSGQVPSEGVRFIMKTFAINYTILLSFPRKLVDYSMRTFLVHKFTLNDDDNKGNRSKVTKAFFY